MYRFLLSRRWIAFALAVVALAVLCIQLGRWQFSRLEERRAENAMVERNLALRAAPLDRLLQVGEELPADLEWRRVTATGRFDPAEQLLVRYQIREGRSGAEVVTPLVTASGVALLVDRGWLATASDPDTRPQVPAPPAGQVNVSGWLRTDQSGDADAVVPQDGQVRLISSEAIASTLPYPVYDGYVQITRVEPPPEVALAAPQPPELSSGPHFFYGLQWLFFALLAVGGTGYLGWSEARMRRADTQRSAAVEDLVDQRR